MENPQLQSLFSQKLDRAVFATYFLGAVVPLIALGAIAHHYALPALEGAARETAGLIGLFTGIGTLSLACFYALRRLTLSALARTDADNDRLAQLLEVSGGLSTAAHEQEVARVAVRSALHLTHAPAAFVLLRVADKPLTLQESEGDRADAIYQAHQEELHQFVESSLQTGEPTIAAADASSARTGGASGTLTGAVVVPLTAEAGPIGAIVVAHTEPGASFGPEQVDVLATLAALTSIALHSADLRGAQRNFFTHMTELLVAMLDVHVEGRSGHSTKVAALSNRIGRSMELSDGRLEVLHFSSLLHDIGMLKIPRSQQRDPAHAQKHPTIGYKILSAIRLWEGVAPIVLHHHEWYDGSGYPEGLSGSTIPLEARILAVADAFDAMIRDDGRSDGLPMEDALEEIRQGTGTQFDPAVTAAFAELAERGEVVAAYR